MIDGALVAVLGNGRGSRTNWYLDAMPASVRLIRQRHMRPVTALLSAAFQEDPLFQWFFPDQATRDVLTGVWMRNSAELSMQTGHGLVHCDDDDTPLAAALWCPPDVELFGPDGFRPRWAMLVGANPGRVDALREGISLIGNAHPEEGHFYLNVVGVDPLRRGQGLGRPLMERVLDVADAEDVPCYLESSNPLNLSFYERYGFEVRGELEMPDGPIIRPMWRPPASN